MPAGEAQCYRYRVPLRSLRQSHRVKKNRLDSRFDHLGSPPRRAVYDIGENLDEQKKVKLNFVFLKNNGEEL